jgi:diguanylate cyclase (GGDEF)-like protein
MGAEDPVAFTAPTGHARFQALLDEAGVRSALLAPLALDKQPLGVIALFSDTRELDREWLNFSKVINGQISQAVALGRTISRLKYLAAYDPLTSLPNRAHLCKRIEELLRAHRQAGSRGALLRINLDRFEEVNNTLSYENGDELLRQVGKRLRERVGEADMIARLDADEFAVLIDALSDRSAATETARKILSDIESPFFIGGFPLAVHASIGLALYPDDATEAEVLMRRADMAMRSAKRSGNRFAAYAAELDQYDPGRLTMMAELREAIDNNHLALHYQPKVSLRTSRIVGVEALVRWQHPRRGTVRPDQFIPLAEKTGLIQLLTQWVLEAALDQARAWKRKGWDLSVSMNLSARNIQDPYFPAQAASLLRENGLGSRGLTMEITESALLEDPAKASKVLTDLSRSGVQFSIDDFGTGYSSLAYLKHLPVSEIKIYRCFVMDLMANPDNATIVRSTIELGHNLGLSVVAEGVEDRQTWQGLAALGCDDAQGYYMCRPLPADALEGWIRESEWGLREDSPLRQSASA